MLLLCYSRCSTCQKAKNWLTSHQIPFDERPIKEAPPTVAELTTWHKASGLPLKRFFNTSGNSYRALGLKDKLPQLTENEQYQLLAADGMLVKRPLVVTDQQQVLLGFRESDWAKTLLPPPEGGTNQ